MNCDKLMTTPVIEMTCPPLWLSEQVTYPANQSFGSDVVQSLVRGNQKHPDDLPRRGNADWYPSAGPR